MNEGEKNGLSNGPIFSSPNIAGSQPQPQSQASVPMPEQQVDITKIGNPSLTTTVASMPEQDGPVKPAVTSGGDPINKKQPRFGFATRRFRGKTQAPAGPVMQAADNPTFANAPDYFNEAMNGIVLEDDVNGQGKSKKFITIGVIAVLVVALFVVGIIAISGGISGGQKQAKISLANRVKNILAKGEDKSDAIDLKITTASDYRKLFIYGDALSASNSCEKTNALISEVAKKNNLGDLAEKISNLCQDMSYRQVPISVILANSETLKYDSMETYVDNMYASKEKHREEIESLRIEQARLSIQVIIGLSEAGCLSGRDVKGACQYEYYGTAGYRKLSQPVTTAEIRYQKIIIDELNAILGAIDGTETKNDQK